MKAIVIAIMLVFFLELSSCSFRQASTLSLIQKSQVHLHELKIELSNSTIVQNNPTTFASNATHSTKNKKNHNVNQTVLSLANATLENANKICDEVNVVTDIISEVDRLVGELTDAFNDHIAKLIQSKKSASQKVDQVRWQSYATKIVDYFILKTNDLRDIIDDVSNAVKGIKQVGCVSPTVKARKSVAAFIQKIQIAADEIGLGNNYVEMKLREINSKSNSNLRRTNKLKN